MDGAVGVKFEGQANFTNLNYRSKVAMHLSIECPETDEHADVLLENLAFALRLDPSQLSLNCLPENKNKRDAAPPGVDLFIEGDMDIPAHSYADDFYEMATSGSSDLASNGIYVENLAATETYVITASEPVFWSTAGGIAAATALSAAAIAGIAIGGAAAVAVAGAGAVVVHKKLVNRKKKEEVADKPIEQAPPKPKGAGANVFDFSAGNVTSITGRGAPQKEWI